MRALHVCSFSGAVADLTKREQFDDEKVLAALSHNPRVSVWDMESAPLRATLERLKNIGAITEEDEPYPWLRFRLAPPRRRSDGPPTA